MKKMKKVVSVFLAFFLFSGLVFAQLVQPPKENPQQIYLFTLVVILIHATGHPSALYFQSIDRFENQENCEKGMHKSITKFKSDIMRMRRMPLRDVKFFGNCQIIGASQEMMFPLEEPAPEKPADKNTLPQ